jgi:NTP pyrophosphatase (non-canonical NTP hydrolase)
MKINEYQMLAARTASMKTWPLAPVEFKLLVFALGLAGEASELLECYVGVARVDVGKVKKESGDTLWYTGQIAGVLDIPMSALWPDQSLPPNPDFPKSHVMSMYGAHAAHHATLLTIHAGQVADEVKKAIGHGHGVNKERIQVMLATVFADLWRIASEEGLTLEEIAQANIAKLQKRYKDGFTTQESINRKSEE